MKQSVFLSFALALIVAAFVFALPKPVTASVDKVIKRETPVKIYLEEKGKEYYRQLGFTPVSPISGGFESGIGPEEPVIVGPWPVPIRGIICDGMTLAQLQADLAARWERFKTTRRYAELLRIANETCEPQPVVISNCGLSRVYFVQPTRFCGSIDPYIPGIDPFQPGIQPLTGTLLDPKF
ncbi:hypothetical protein LX64_01377 [Chitinophaga skermanii]|uniref:Uncharacterized protein n=1 Tax=Chitinophaga skermanii TaxID=331697 RepID=A0A327QZ70_9BACT|nr:hypothetical protein [Chitinophaga skermanii]RAJ08723.1 hypothetical protein LX64_01377 [Chitinophaga skermanii]